MSNYTVIITLIMAVLMGGVEGATVVNSTDGNVTNWNVKINEGLGLNSGDPKENFSTGYNHYIKEMREGIGFEDYMSGNSSDIEIIAIIPPANTTEAEAIAAAEEDNILSPALLFVVILAIMIGGVGGYFVIKKMKGDPDLVPVKNNEPT